MNSIFNKFTTHSKSALKNAFDFALSCGHRAITPQHVLYGLAQEKGSIAAQILNKARIESLEIKEAVASQNPIRQTAAQISLAANTKKLLEKAFLIASLNQHKYIGTEHLLASILTIKDDVIIDFFRQKDIKIMELQMQIDTVLNSTSKFPDLIESAGYPGGESAGYYNPLQQTAASQPAALDIFGVNLTDSAIQKDIDPLIGREEEISRLIQILSRRNKNNPLLLGDPGVGKTAIVEGLAKKIVLGEVPEVLSGKIIYTLDLSLVVAGTSFRGEFENRLKQILMEVKKNPDIILFIDEIHNLVGAGATTGSMDAANILKPALARGEIRCIGATTLDGYKKYIEADPALERRFQPINIDQPTVEKTMEILQGIKSNYEIFHQVKISDEAIEAAARLSERFIPDRFLPDKAIDLIDEAASAVKIKQPDNAKISEIKNLEKRLEDIREKKKDSVTSEKFNLALKLRVEEQTVLSQLKNLKAEQSRQKQKIKAEIGQKDIASIVAKMTGVPLDDLVSVEKNRLLKLEGRLAKKIVDQEQTLKTVAEFIRCSRTGIADAKRPIGSFIFLGPSGVGKTETAKVLAEVVFGNPQSLVRIDMSEFAESFNISKLIGAPAGYIGYKDGAKLTDAVRRRPYSLILFDEIEKAHQQVFNLLLQVLEDGCLTDGTGKVINFKNTIIVMTSNLGSESFNQQTALGFQAKIKDEKKDLEKSFAETKEAVLKKLKEKFPPEFLSRVDKTVVFNPLGIKAIAKIAALQLEELKNRLARQGLDIEFEPAVAKLVAKISYTPETGARAVRKTIQELIESKVANIILSSKEGAEKIIVRVKDGKIII